MGLLQDNRRRAGKYRKRITIQQDLGTTTDEYGKPIPNLKPFASVWASITPTEGHEYLLGPQVVAMGSDVIEISYLPGVLPLMTCLYTDDKTNLTRTFEIHSVIDPEERHIKLFLLCQEKTQ